MSKQSIRKTSSHLNRTVGFCLAGVVFMGGMAYAAVPLYDLFCRVTGYAGTTNRAETASDTIIERQVTVRFDASRNRQMPWEFTAPENAVSLKVGETGLAFYKAHNPTDEELTGTATFNVTPQKAGYYFSKIDCFCFVEQTLAPGETVDMPVTFFIDPEIAEDDEMNDIKTITLSYTFFLKPKPASEKVSNQAALNTKQIPQG
ncbi:ATP synthase subunit beta 1 protein [Candidatus Micropelagos thuwalensis]|jgi:cytochrome c oxidase assembly protein subunit 11|uniref:Cytochrome c oxidase assembly protein CtaG n=1 Tax=Candidatus Micropelagius thuwalensis TaxID=1397666 RepID=U2WS09_9PROT|nr:cytochrome c oxidase assembly protein [Candidatus Micropelagos thuwalensis]ERL46340.1 ATP synthase subunit beta 1 protein [Candidatus Micropelagos thuwalensis]